MSDYFNAVGQKVCAMLANDPAARQRLRQFADGALSRHTAGPMAKDAMPIAGKVFLDDCSWVGHSAVSILALPDTPPLWTHRRWPGRPGGRGRARL